MIDLQSNQSKFILLLFSRVWVALVGIVFVPIYVNILGAESYGLVAFSGTLAGSLAVLDLGLSTAINRQVAILKTQQNVENFMPITYTMSFVSPEENLK